MKSLFISVIFLVEKWNTVPHTTNNWESKLKARLSYKIHPTTEEKNEIDLDLSFELAEKDKMFYKQTPANTLVKDMEKLWFFYEWCFFSMQGRRN